MPRWSDGQGKSSLADQNDIWMVQSGAGIQPLSQDYEPSTKEVAQIYDADVFVYHSQTLNLGPVA